MSNWWICWFFTHIFIGDFNFKGLTARRLYKPFGVKGLMFFKEDKRIPVTATISELILLLNANRPGYGLNNEEYLEQEYHVARRLGEEGADCRLTYPTCPYGEGLLDLISVLDT
jgi:hypothetical protein